MFIKDEAALATTAKYESTIPCKKCGCVVRSKALNGHCVICLGDTRDKYKGSLKFTESKRMKRDTNSDNAIRIRECKVKRQETGMTHREREEYKIFCELRSKGEWCGY